VTLWENTFDPFVGKAPPANATTDLAARYLSLAEPAAVWLYYSLLARDPDDHLRPLGTRSWLSYAHFRAGVRWYELRDDARARALFLEAVKGDRGNLGAHLNLAAMEAGRDEQQEQAARFDYVKRSVESAATKRGAQERSWRTFDERDAFRWDALWYRASLSKAVGILNACEKASPELKRLAAEAYVEAFELMWVTERTLADLRQKPEDTWPGSAWRKRDADERSLQLLLEAEWQNQVYVFAGAVVWARNAPVEHANAHSLLKVRLGSAPCPRDAPLANAMKKALSTIHDPLTQLSIAVDNSISELGGCELAYTTRHNRACYLATRLDLAGGTHTDADVALALADLRHAVHAGWCWTAGFRASDPGLKPIRDGDSLGFDRIVALARSREGAGTKGLLRTELSVVDEESAAALEACGVTSCTELRRHLLARQIGDLAKRSGVDQTLLRRWGSVAAVIEHLDDDTDANAARVLSLAAARAGSVLNLQAQAEPDRMKSLEGALVAAVANGRVVGEPSRNDLERWSKALEKAVLDPVLDA
jgi:hypothetical protein